MRHTMFMTALIAGLALSAAASAKSATAVEKNAMPDDVTANPCEKLEDTKSVYNNETHKFKGCRVLTVPAGSAYEKIGLKTGDLVQPGSGQARSMELLSEGKPADPDSRN
jgi:hypothetical protein